MTDEEADALGWKGRVAERDEGFDCRETGDGSKKVLAARATGEWRAPREGEWFISGGEAWRATADMSSQRCIATLVVCEKQPVSHNVLRTLPGQGTPPMFDLPLGVMEAIERAVIAKLPEMQNFAACGLNSDDKLRLVALPMAAEAIGRTVVLRQGLLESPAIRPWLDLEYGRGAGQNGLARHYAEQLVNAFRFPDKVVWRTRAAEEALGSLRADGFKAGG